MTSIAIIIAGVLLILSYCYFRRRRLLLGVMNCSLYVWVLRYVVPRIRFSLYSTKMTGPKYHEGYTKLRPGDIVLTCDPSKLSSMLIPGDFAHAALCVGKKSDDDDYEIAEMVADGYSKNFFFDSCHHSGRVVILECTTWDDAYIDAVIKRCKSFSGMKYDTKFLMGVKALYCSELGYHSDFERRMGANTEDMMGLGQEYITPQGLFNAEHTRVVWDSDATTNREN